MEAIHRAKLYKNNQWVNGWIVKNKFATNKHFIVYFPNEDDEYFYDVAIPESIGTFTGLYDINGKPIYTGDIVKTYLSCPSFKNEDIALVIFNEQEAAFGVLWNRNGLTQIKKCFSAFACVCNTTYEIIGNKIDNPELLKEV